MKNRLHTVSLRQLRYFLCVCDTLNFTQAAQQLHIAQPPLSRQIQQLEQLLGVELFERHSQAVRLTSAGATLRAQLQPLLLQLEQTLANSAHPPTHRMRLGYTTVFDCAKISAAFAQFTHHYPQWPLQLKPQSSIQSIRQLQRGQLDAALIGLPSATGDLRVEPLWQERWQVALPATHVLAESMALSWAQLAKEPLFWFARARNPGFYDHCWAFFQKIGFTPNHLLEEPDDHHILLGLIASGQGLALIPESLVSFARPGVVFRPLLGEQPELGLALAYLEDSPALQSLLSCLTKRSY